MHVNPFRKRLGAAFAVLLGSWLTICQALALPPGWESYDERPDITSVVAQNHPNLGYGWQEIKAAQLAFVAELLEFYPKDTHIYFLGRDMEYAYDTAKLVTQGTPEESRIHLLNVSSKNLRDPNLRGYLRQNGISEETLADGRKVLFVDSAFEGSIPSFIRTLFAEKYRSQIKTHMVVSSVAPYPSSRAFLVHLNPDVNHRSPPSMNGTIASYEHMPRYTDRSTQFFFENGKYHAISEINGHALDGSVSKVIALRQMQDLKADWNSGRAQKTFAQKRAVIRWIKNTMTSADPVQFSALKMQMKKVPLEAKNFYEAVIRDMYAVQVNTSFRISYQIQDFDLKPVADYTPAELAKSQDIAHAHPEWGKILDEPHSQIKILFMAQDWATIAKLIEADISPEVNEILMKRLFDGPATGAKKALQISMIERKDQFILEYLASDIFSRPQAREMKDLIQLTSKYAGTTAKSYLEQYVFSEPHGKDLQAISCKTVF